MSFKDYFSGHAAQYALARPLYPEALPAYLASQCPRHRRAWDAATGNGQAALGLAPHFDEVYATDASRDQIDAAVPGENIRYRCEPAERCGLADASTDLVTVAQAAHWLDHPRFFAEVARVLDAGGVLALWCYGVNQVSAEVDRIVDHYYREVVGAYWPPERHHIEEGYAGITLPWPAETVPAFEIRVTWNREAFCAYLRSWSASQRCLADIGEDPLAPLEADLHAAWGESAREVVWPIYLKQCRKT